MRREIAAYLRKTTPDHVSRLNDEELLLFINKTERLGTEWGLKTQAGQGRFAWFQYMSDGDFALNPEIRSYIAGSDGKADERLRLLMEAASGYHAHGSAQ